MTPSDPTSEAIPPGPYRVEWPTEQGGLFSVWGQTTPNIGGWAIPLVAMGTESIMEWLADHLNALAALPTTPTPPHGTCRHGWNGHADPPDECRHAPCPCSRFGAPHDPE